MITVLSPAKKLSAECSSNGSAYTKPVFLDHSENLVEILRSFDPIGLQSLMGISENLSELNWERFQNGHQTFLLISPGRRYTHSKETHTPGLTLTIYPKKISFLPRIRCVYSLGFMEY